MMVHYKKQPPRRRKATKATDKYPKDQRRLDDLYESHVKSIKSLLPENAWLLANARFHDADVRAVEEPSKQLVVITLYGECTPLFRDSDDVVPEEWIAADYHTLSFHGVKKLWLPSGIVGDVWTNAEIHHSDIAAFDYRIALRKHRIRLQADDVSIRAIK